MENRARTKIVATAGPATQTPERIRHLIEAGVSVFRLNFSHGAHADHRQILTDIRSIAKEVGVEIGIMQDLQGPKLRIGNLDSRGPARLNAGDRFRICTREILGTTEMVSTSYERLAQDLSPGDPVLIDDGRIRLTVAGIETGTEFGDIVTLDVIHGGELAAHKGINLPESTVTAPALTAKDRNDLAFGIQIGVDMIALSFVRRAADLDTAREMIRAASGSQPLIAKIEKPQAVANLQEIVDAADGLMVARGDLGVELSPEAVPLIQKRLIRLANIAGKPVITATQMLESMIRAPHPTRAEASDVANAILDGTDAVMLSGETAVGDNPVDAVRTMASIARTVERERAGTPWQLSRQGIREYDDQTESEAVGHAARALADDLRARAIVVLTRTGATAMNVSMERPIAPIIALTNDVSVGRRLALWHGVVPVVTTLDATIDALLTHVDREIASRGFATPGDRVVVVGANRHRADVRSIFVEVHTVAEG